jgi:hypothetical protein
MAQGNVPRDSAAPVMTSQVNALAAELICNRDDIGSKPVEPVSGNATGLVTEIVTALIEHNDA